MRFTKFILYVWLLSCSLATSAQQRYFSAGIGGALPVGGYKNDFYTSTGWHLHLADYDHYFNKHFGFTGQWTITINMHDDSRVNEEIGAIPGVRIESGNWYNGRLVAGPSVRVATGKLSLEWNIHAGVSYLFAPEYVISFSSGFAMIDFEMKRTAEESNGLAWGSGIKLRYQSHQSVCYHLTIDYAAAYHQVNYEVVSNNFIGNEAVEVFPQNIGIGLGIGYKLK